MWMPIVKTRIALVLDRIALQKLGVGELVRMQGLSIRDFCWSELDSDVRKLIGNSI